MTRTAVEKDEERLAMGGSVQAGRALMSGDRTEIDARMHRMDQANLRPNVGILRMLAERVRVSGWIETDRQRKLIQPRKVKYGLGFRMIRDFLSGRVTDPETAAFCEGIIAGMMDGGCDQETGWRISDARKRALKDAEKA